MPKADVYYYPSGLGHIGVNIIFQESEVPDENEYPILVYSTDNHEWKNKCKLYARTHYRPAVFFNEKISEYSIYGLIDGVWTESNLFFWPGQLELFQSLPFTPITTNPKPKSIKTTDPLYDIMQNYQIRVRVLCS